MLPAPPAGRPIPTTHISLIHVIGAIAALCAAGSFFIFPDAPQWKLRIVVAWMILPPVYFFFELHWVRRNRPERLAACKESQESAAKIWAGVVAALAFLYLHL